MTEDEKDILRSIGDKVLLATDASNRAARQAERGARATEEINGKLEGVLFQIHEAVRPVKQLAADMERVKEKLAIVSKDIDDLGDDVSGMHPTHKGDKSGTTGKENAIVSSLKAFKDLPRGSQVLVAIVVVLCSAFAFASGKIANLLEKLFF